MKKNKASNVGISLIEVYIPQPKVDIEELERHHGASKGKYTKGLGQETMSLVTEAEDSVSMALTVLDRLVTRHKVDPKQIGRLEVGTETLLDKSKSIKSFLMQYLQLKDNTDLEGIMSVHACYGGTAALFNTVAWMESEAWDGRLGVVICSDIAVYDDGSSRATAGAGAVALLISPNADLPLESIRATHMIHEYDFYKPNMSSEYPTVDGPVSVRSYLSCLTNCYRGLKQKYQKALGMSISLDDFDQILFHSPFFKQVKKAFLALCYQDL